MIEYAELFPAAGTWHVRFTSAAARLQALRLFGTDTIPTPFCLPLTYDQVRAELAKVPANRDTCFVEARPETESCRYESEASK